VQADDQSVNERDEAVGEDSDHGGDYEEDTEEKQPVARARTAASAERVLVDAEVF
jgi:hypothetical protein